MRKTFAIAAAAFSLSVAVSPLSALAQTNMIDGQVTKIDASAGKITIKHGPIKKFDMDDGMTMVFRVADPAMLNTFKAGDRIKFEPDRVNGQFTVKSIQKAK